jgi:hypothetical protein
VSERGVAEIYHEIENKWQARGLSPLGEFTDFRAVLLAVDEIKKNRYALTLWIVPPSIRQHVSQGYPVQGSLAVFEGHGSWDNDSLESSGEVPGVPLREGGRAGALFSSLDRGGRSYTGVYTLSGGIEGNLRYYLDILSDDGWRRSIPDLGDLSESSAFLNLRRNGEELVILFSELKEPGSDLDRTVATVIRSPKFAGGA